MISQPRQPLAMTKLPLSLDEKFAGRQGVLNTSF
jgi:hypothetical protein